MFDRIKRLFGKKAKPAEIDPKVAEEWDTLKSAKMEDLLGKEHDMVMHALIPFAIGGGLDLYYYPNGVQGTGIATKELSVAPGEGPSNDEYDNYELVMFTKHALDLDHANDEQTAFGKAHGNMNGVLNVMARYAGMATLNPGDTAEFPEEMEGLGGKCFILDAYGEGGRAFGIMVVVEVFRSEMEFARKNKGEALIKRLKEAGHWPYSDMERAAVA